MTLSDESHDIELLEAIDDALRNGRNMTQANRAFDMFMERVGYSRNDLPSYRRDIEELEKADAEWLLCTCEHFLSTHTARKYRCNNLGCSCTRFVGDPEAGERFKEALAKSAAEADDAWLKTMRESPSVRSRT